MGSGLSRAAFDLGSGLGAWVLDVALELTFRFLCSG
jgi:hypothetical protein